MMGNFALFFYGFGARLVQIFGGAVLVYGWLSASIIFAIIGIIVMVFGYAMRFNYQRQSGSIIHRGDW